MFWIALIAQAAAAQPPPPPGHVGGLLSWTDYPPSALDKNEQGPVYIQLVVNPEGRVDSCSVLLSNGYGDLDLATCNIVTKRARFSPAQDETGKPIYSTYRQVITWRIAGTYSAVPPAPEMPPDFDLTLNQAPQGVKLPERFNISYFIKANGTTSHCQGSDAGKPPPQVLVDLACKVVLQSPVQVIRNHNNQPVDGANCQTVVRFSIDSNKR